MCVLNSMREGAFRDSLVQSPYFTSEETEIQIGEESAIDPAVT